MKMKMILIEMNDNDHISNGYNNDNISNEYDSDISNDYNNDNNCNNVMIILQFIHSTHLCCASYKLALVHENVQRALDLGFLQFCLVEPVMF